MRPRATSSEERPRLCATGPTRARRRAFARHSALLFVALLLGALAGSRPALAEEFRFTLLHTTDLHGALTSYDYLANRPASRGLTRIATLVREARAEGRPVLLLDAGDVITGGPLETVYRGGARSRPDPMMSAMNAIGYDAMAVGNHEFDALPQELQRTRREAKFPWLAANVFDGRSGKRAFAPSLVKKFGAVRVGVVGLCTPAVPFFEDSVQIAGLRFGSPLEAARAEVARLRSAERCDVVVLLAHTGLEKESESAPERKGDTPGENWGYRLASAVPGVDACILGHSHATVPWLRVGRVLVSQAGKWGEQLGRIDFTLTRDAPGAPWTVAARGQLRAVSDSVAEDPAILALAAPYHEATLEKLDQVVGEASAAIEAPNGRLAGSAPLSLIHRVQLWQSGADVSLTALPDAGARIAAGPVRVRDLMRLYPYDNRLVVVEMSGADLERALERSAEYFQTYTFEDGRALPEPGRPGFNFDAAEGVSYEIDLTRPAGERIRGLTFRGEPLDAARRLRVAVNNYRANGGGGFEEVRTARRVTPSGWRIHELLLQWIRARKTLDAGFEENWRIVPDYVLRSERPLVDRLVRRGALTADEAGAIATQGNATRGETAVWLARAWNVRAPKASGAFDDVSDSLAPWVDGLLRHGAFGRAAESDHFRPADALSLPRLLDWCTNLAAKRGFAFPTANDRAAFRRSLLTGLATRPGAREPDAMSRGTLERAEALAIVANARFPQLRVLETTDFHGAILPGATDRRSARAIGGSAVLAAHIEKLRRENPEGTVLLDGGDCFQGTMISNLQFGAPVVEQMNALGYQAMAIGNHEFDWTVDTLQARVHEMKFSALGANMIERRTKKLPRWVRADTAFVRRGIRIGVLGLCYRSTPSVTMPANVRHLSFDDDSGAAARSAKKLRLRDRASLVLAVGHVSAESDSLRHARGGDLLRLARGVRGVDAWFGGHSHNTVVDEVDGVPLLIAGSHGQYVGVCDLVLDGASGKVLERRTRLQTTFADEVRPDSLMAARVERWNAHVKDVAGVHIGENVRTLMRNRGGESSVGNLVTDAMRAASGVDVALQNSGGLRADLPAGEITRGSIYEIMPFDNTLVTLELTGAELVTVLEEGLKYGRVTQASGLRYQFDPDRPEMQRVVEVTLARGEPLDRTKTYRIAVNNFMATGGDNYVTLSRGRNVVDTGLVIRGALEEHVTKLTRGGTPLDVKDDGRIRRSGSRESPSGSR